MTRRFRSSAAVLVLGVASLSLTVRAAQDARPAAAEEHAAEFKTIEADFARFDDLLSRYNEPVTRVNVFAYRSLAKGRADALRENFDQSKYDELRYDLNLHCQRMANW